MRYALKVFSPEAGIHELAIEAASPTAAAEAARRQGLTVLSSRSAALRTSFFSRQAAFPLLLFSHQLLSLLEAGLTLVESLEALAAQDAHDESRNILDGLLAGLREGRRFADVLETRSNLFPPFYVAAIRAGEGSGGLVETLRRFVAYQTQIDAVRKKLVSAMIYPLLLLFVGALVTTFLLGYVVPRFARIYEERAGDLPWLSQLLFEWGGWIGRHGLLASAIAAGGIGFVAWWGTRSGTRAWLLARAWSLPLIGERLRLHQLGRCYRTLGMLLRGGLPMVPAAELVGGLLSPSLRPALESAILRLREGQSISSAFGQGELVTPVTRRLIQVGERTGDMGAMMERAAAFCEDENARWVDVFARIFEPALMALIGAVVGGIVILLYLPIFELAGSLK